VSARAWIRRVAPLAAAACLVLALPELASACPVCMPEDDESRAAFLSTTAFLTVLPLAVLGGGIGVLRWRYLQQRRGQRSARRSIHRAAL
jgi:hypothetical protein